MNKPLFLEESIDRSLKILKEFEPKEGYYLAFGGGKDSVVLYDLAEKAGVKFDAHHNLLPEPPELVRFISEHYPQIKHERPEETMWELIPRKLMPPTRMVRYCCEVLKESGGEGRVVLTGIRRAESARRKSWKVVSHCGKKGKQIVNPILYWTDDEVWSFIHSENLPYCELYDQGFKRLGCIGCPLSSNAKREFERWPKYKEMYLRAFDKMLKERERRGKPTDMWKTPDDVMKWWLSGGFGEGK